MPKYANFIVTDYTGQAVTKYIDSSLLNRGGEIVFYLTRADAEAFAKQQALSNPTEEYFVYEMVSIIVADVLSPVVVAPNQEKL